jgi:hypothetical protein
MRIALRLLANSMVIFAMILAFTGCDPAQSSRGVNPENQNAAQASFITANSLDDLVRRSPFILIGHVDAKDDIINMARDVNNINTPDSNLFGVGQTYRVSVQRYLKGGGSDTIELVQAEGVVNRLRAEVTDQEIQRARATYPYVPVGVGATYVFFLMPLDGFPKEAYYVGTVNPSRFLATQDGMAEPESAWMGARGAFPPTPMAQFVALLEQRTSAPAN